MASQVFGPGKPFQNYQDNSIHTQNYGNIGAPRIKSLELGDDAKMQAFGGDLNSCQSAQLNADRSQVYQTIHQDLQQNCGQLTPADRTQIRQELHQESAQLNGFLASDLPAPQ